MDLAFRALADPSRRRLLDRLNERNGQTLRERYTGLDMARQSVSKQLATRSSAASTTRRLTLLVPEGKVEAADRRRERDVTIRDLVALAAGRALSDRVTRDDGL
jgi:DNA-binding transcriptional ArsR family regulator